MKIDFDPAKDAINRTKHGMSLSAASRLDWKEVIFVADRRRDYQEPRLQVYGEIDRRLYVLVVTPRDGLLRAISLRKANKREIRRYGRPKVQP